MRKYTACLCCYVTVVLITDTFHEQNDNNNIIIIISLFEGENEIVDNIHFSHKFSVWAWNMWNPCDAAAIIFYLIGLSLRLKPGSMTTGRVMFCVDIIYWYLRILNILGVNKYLGSYTKFISNIKLAKNSSFFFFFNKNGIL